VISVWSNSLLPQICNAGPSDAFSRRTSSTTSPPMRCEFSQSSWSRRMATRVIKLREGEEPAQEMVQEVLSQSKRPEVGRFLLQVD
jgi:hypothetical protein